MNGYDAWALFEACAQGDVPKVKALLAKDPRLVNAQYWYQFPIHMAVRAGHAEIVKLLLDQGADPGQSRFTYNSWDKLLLCARERGYRRIESMLERAMRRRFHYRPDFDVLKEAIIASGFAKDRRGLAAAAEPGVGRATRLGNNALHWSVITRQLGLIERFVELGTPIDAQRADGQTPVLLAVNGATDYWYRATARRIASFAPKHVRDRREPARPGSALHHLRGGSRRRSGARRASCCGRMPAWPGASTRRESAPCPTRRARAICTSSVCCSSTAPIRIFPKTAAPEGGPSTGPVAGITWRSPSCCWSTAPIRTPAWIRRNAVVTIGRIYHGDQAKPLQELLRRHGAYTPPYSMDVAQMKQAIRDGHEVVRHEEFLGNLIEKRDAKLLDLYLDSDPNVPELLSSGCGITYPRSPALVRRLLGAGLDPNRPDWLGKTFLHACADNGDRSVAAVFSGRRSRHRTPASSNSRERPSQPPFAHVLRATIPRRPSAARGWSSSC